MRVYIGFDPRQPLAYTVCQSSILRRASKPVEITPLILSTLPINRRGLTEFTYSRFLVPHLCNFLGDAVFLDADIIVLDDICKLPGLRDGIAAVSVAKNCHKYEWPSVMLFQNSMCRKLTPGFVQSKHNNPYTFEWAPSIGELPAEWNHLVGYDPPRTDAKVVHFTQGIPCWPQTQDCEYADQWREELRWATSTVSFNDLMGTSVHAKHVLARQKEKAYG